MAESYTVEAKLIADIANYTRGIQQATQQMQGFENKVNSSSAGVQKSTSSWGSSVEKAAQVIKGSTIVAGAALTALGLSSLKNFGEFQKGLNEASVIAGGTGKDIDSLGSVVMDMGDKFGISSETSVEALKEMARNGASVDEMKSMFPAVAQAAIGAGEGIDSTAGVVQQAMNVWGKSLESPQQAAAILTQSANLSNASIGSMQQALATLGPTAVNSGMSLSDTSTAIGLLTNTGTSSAEAAQQLRHALVMMQSPSKIAAGAAKELGINFRDAEGNMKPLPMIAEELNGKLGGLSKAQQDLALKQMFGVSGMQAMRTIMGSVADKSGDAKTSWSAYASEMDRVSGNTEKATDYLNNQADAMQQNLGSQIGRVKEGWKNLGMESVKATSGMATDMAKMTANTLNWARKSDEGSAKAIRGLIGYGAAIGPVLTASASAINPIVTLGKSTFSAGSAMFNAAGKATKWVGSLVGIGGKSKAAITSLQQVTTASNGASGSAQKAGSAFGGFSGAVLKVGVGVGVATAGIGAMAFGIAALAQSGTQGVIAVTAVSVAIIAVTGALTLMAPILTANTAGLFALSGVFFSLSAVILSVSVAFLSFGAMVTMIGAGILMATTGISGMIMAFIQLTTVMNQIVPTFTAIGTGAAMMMVSFLTAITGNMPIIIQGMVSIMNGILTAVSTTAPRIITTVLNMMLQFLQAIASKIGPIASTAIQIMIGFLNAIASKIGAVINAATNVIVNFLNGLNRNIPRIIPAAVRVIVTFINGIANNLGQIIDAGINLLFKFIDGIVSKIPEIADRARDAVMKFVYGVGYTLGEVVGSGTKLLDMFVQGIRAGFGQAQGAGNGSANAVRNGISGFSLFNDGYNMMMGFANGIASMAGHVMNVASSIANAAVRTIKSALSIHSPSRVMKEIGVYTGEGLVIGMQNMINPVASMSDRMTQAMMIDPSETQLDYSLTSTSDNLKVGASGALAISLNDTNFNQPAYINLEMGDNTYGGFAENINQTNGNNIRLSSRYGI
ncbi:phage tail tape measure protein [Weissella minor]|uniref:phage tail tape measure protein n=1 Tax=Weissella minor TaxID=1620 RepID=UPI003AF27BAB